MSTVSGVAGADAVSRETQQRLEAYVTLLGQWAPQLNLVSRGDLATVWTRHIADSLQLATLIPPNTPHAVDIGSGAGFPGLILAITTGTPFVLVESDRRKAAFLLEAARLTAAPVTVEPRRIEDAARSPSLAPATLVTARAVAPLHRLLAWAAPVLASGGVCLFPKGRSARAELDEAAALWQMDCDMVPSTTEPDAVILVIRNPRLR